jgi:hypothetical protein
MKLRMLTTVIVAFSCFLIGDAYAECSTVPVKFRIENNSVLTTTGATDGAPCRNVFTSKDVRYENSTIEKKAKNGKLEKENLTTFVYTPKKGFKGKDAYSIKMCGYSSRNEPGCVTITYEIEVK